MVVERVHWVKFLQRSYISILLILKICISLKQILIIYASPRTREDVAERLLCEIRTHENFILASVKGDYGEELYSFFQCAILLDVPRDIR